MNKKQTIIISVLLVLIVFAGYLATQVNGPLYVTDDKFVGETAKTSTKNNFFTEATVTREQSKAKTLQQLKTLIDDQNTPADQKAQASEEYKNIAVQSDKEVSIELSLKSQGYEEALCTLDKDKAVVIVKTEKELTDQQIRQIKDVVMSKSNIKNIEIKVAQ
jgi:stage III sporulation protein AH